MKTCTKCNVEQSCGSFFKMKKNKDGLSYYCKICEATIRREKRHKNQQHREEVNLKIAQYRRNRYLIDSEYRHHKNTKYADYVRKRKNVDRVFTIKGNIRTLLYGAFKRHSLIKRNKTEEILGISLADFILKIDHMAIAKYGTAFDSTIMDLDHIIPLCSAKTEEEVIKLNHHTNLQPLSREDHITKTKNDISNWRRTLTR